MTKFCLSILFSIQLVLVNGQMDIPADLFESDAEKKYRTLNAHQIKPDSNYATYWCSSEILLNTHENLESLSLSDIAYFLATFHPSCFDNAEFSEWSNELLFEVLRRHPRQTLEILAKNNSLYRGKILWEFRHPIHDGIDLPGLVAILRSIEETELVDARNIVLDQIPSQ